MILDQVKSTIPKASTEQEEVRVVLGAVAAKGTSMRVPASNRQRSQFMMAMLLSCMNMIGFY